MQRTRLILIGGGGHCKSCIDVIERTNKFDIVGILDVAVNVGVKVLNYEIIGTDEELPSFINPETHFLITIGQIKTAAIRMKIFQQLVNLNANIATVVSPTAHVSIHAKIGFGTIVMHQVVVNADVNIGSNCILNTGCIIEHDSVVGNHTHVSTQAVINGGCVLGDEVFIGSNSTLANQRTIASRVIVGTGTVVVKNVDEPGIYVGNPIRKIS